jgi:hypothetical protein
MAAPAMLTSRRTNASEARGTAADAQRWTRRTACHELEFARVADGNDGGMVRLLGSAMAHLAVGPSDGNHTTRCVVMQERFVHDPCRDQDLSALPPPA